MPCSDSSSSICLKLDKEEKFLSFDFAKITCGREITSKTGYSGLCQGRPLPEILSLSFPEVLDKLQLKEEEAKFILYLEWDALRSTIAQYLGVDDAKIDKERCKITSIEYTDEGIEVAEVILPPKELPKILPCSLGDKGTA